MVALATFLGIDPKPLLEETEPTRIVAMRAALERAAELKEKADKSLANRIVQEVGKMFRG